MCGTNEFNILNSDSMRKNVFILLFLFVAVCVYSQKVVNGIVTDVMTNNPVIGANVIEKQSPSNGTITDLDGKFKLTVKDNSVLEISYIGYIPQVVNIPKDSKVINVYLKEDTKALDEVVVIGYGTAKKRDLTGSVAQVKSKDLTSFTVSNPIQALQGRVAGVVITSNTGAPNGNFQIRIRGTNSIRGDNSPLYIIDGIPSSVNSINTYDITSVEVLKDASATAIYGSRGANGVVMITTKRGEKGRTKVSYNMEYGVQSQIKKWDLCDASEWMQLINIQQLNDNGKVYFTDNEIASVGKGYSWQDHVFRSAPVWNHNMNISGGSDKTQYSISASAQMRDGLIKNSSFDKYNIRTTINTQLNDYFKLDLISGYTRTATSSKNSSGSQRGSSLMSAALTASPATTPYNEDGSYRNLQLDWPFMSNGMDNPLNLINETKDKNIADMEDIQAVLTFNPIKDLTIKSTLGYTAYNDRIDGYTTNKYLYSSSKASISSNQQTTVVNENIINYNHLFGKAHRIDLTAGQTYQQYIGKSVSASGSTFFSDVPESYDLGSAATINTPSSDYTKWQLLSYLARANYSYNGKYIATVSMRADGSSRYSEGDKWGYFPSGALAWRISDENFLKGIKTISDLKLRVGYGQTGSQAITPYTTLNMLTSDKAVIGTSPATYYAAKSTYPGKLKWETTDQWNVGIDLGILSQRLRFTVDYYNKMTRNLLNAVTLPPSSGYNNTIQNIGKMSNKGFEVNVEADILRQKDLSWNVSVNWATNKNRVEKLYDASDLYGSVGCTYLDGTVSMVREGEPLGVFYVFKENGYDEKGMIKYVDVDGNGSYTNADRFILGNPNPDFTYGFNSDLRFKNFEFSFFLQGSQGNDIYNVSGSSNLDYGWGLNMERDVLYSHWSETNPNAKYPKITKKISLMHSDRFIEDGSYLRLKNVVLAYNIPMQKLGVSRWISNMRIYASAQNILTITSYSGIDPEINSWGSGNSITQGLDFLTYPNSKSISFGAQIQF